MFLVCQAARIILGDGKKQESDEVIQVKLNDNSGFLTVKIHIINKK